jgi:hypothetical protein
MVTKKFQSPTLWQLKNFSHQPCDDWKFFDRLSVATETFWSPWKGACHMFLESVQQRLTKNIWHTPFLATEKLWSPSDNGVVLDGNWNFSFAQEGMEGYDFFSKMILHVLPLSRWPKNFNYHLMYPHYRMVTERSGACVIILGKKKSSPILHLRWSKNFNHHPMVWVCWMVIEFF